MARNQSYQPEIKEFEEKVVQVNRVSKKTKGGVILADTTRETMQMTMAGVGPWDSLRYNIDSKEGHLYRQHFHTRS